MLGLIRLVRINGRDWVAVWDGGVYFLVNPLSDEPDVWWDDLVYPPDILDVDGEWDLE